MGHDAEARKTVVDLMARGMGDHKIADTLLALGYTRADGTPYTRHGVRRMMHESSGDSPQISPHVQSIEHNTEGMIATGVCQARSLEEMIALLGADMNEWRVFKWVGNQWGGGDMWQIKVWFTHKLPQEYAIEHLITRLQNNAPVAPMLFSYAPLSGGNRALEISVADPHFGLRAFKPVAGSNYNFRIAEDLWRSSIKLLLERADPYRFDNIIFPMGNDIIHADNVWHTTTGGTGQPEMDSWHHTFMRVEELLIETIAGLASLAPVHVPVVPGNHGRQSEFALGRILKAYFHNNPNVTVDCSGSPYTFVRYGCNLIGLEHGHSIKANRLASLMAAERPEDWAETWNREWHCADQHRDSALMSEFGVVIRYLPSMVATNEWAKIKSFSSQHRASLGFIYGKEEGRIGSVQVNYHELTDCFDDI